MPHRESAPFRPPGDAGLEVLVSGPESALPLVFHNGTPAGLVAFEPMLAAAADRGLRTSCTRAPATAASTPSPGRSVADAAGDVAAVLDDLSAGEFVDRGLVRRRPPRARLRRPAARPLAEASRRSRRGAADGRRPGLDGRHGRREHHGVRPRPWPARPELVAFLTAEAAELRDVTADQVVAGLGDLASDVDKAVITGEFAGYLAAAFRASVRRRHRRGGTTTWPSSATGGSSLDIEVPVTVWQGGPGHDGPVRARPVAGGAPAAGRPLTCWPTTAT